MTRNLRRAALVLGLVCVVHCQRNSAETQTAARPHAPAGSAVTIPPPGASDAGAGEPELIEPVSPADASSDASSLSPAVVVRGAIARSRYQASKDRAVVLLKRVADTASCQLPDGDPEIVMTACGWAAGECTSQQVSIKNGVVTNYRARLRVIDAPAQTGSRGRVQIEDSDDTNVHGGLLEVIVCD